MAATQQDRVNTIIALINSCPSISTTNVNKLKAEFREVTSVDAITPTQRRNILKILHSTRALDSTLKVILDYYSIRGTSHSIGQYLFSFSGHSSTRIGKLSASERSKYQNSIVKVRNTHLHEANSYPRNDSEVHTLLSEMQTLIARVVSL